MAEGVRNGSPGNSSPEPDRVKLSLRRLPEFLLRARGYFLKRDDCMNTIAKGRGIFGVATLVLISIAYPGYTRTSEEILPIPPYILPGVSVGQLKFDTIWLISIVYSLVFSVMWIAVFAVLVVIVAKVRALPSLLLPLLWPVLSVALFVTLALAILEVLNIVGRVSFWANLRNNSNPALLEKLGIFLIFLGLIAVFAILAIWLAKLFYLAATDVFRADDAHPFLAPFVTTATSWTLASIALSSGGQPGVPRTVGWVMTLTGPVLVTVINVVACQRIRAENDGQLWFRDGPRGKTGRAVIAAPGVVSGQTRRRFLWAGLSVWTGLRLAAVGTTAWGVTKSIPVSKSLANTASNTLLNLWSNKLSGQALISSVMFRPHGHTLAAGTSDGTIILWDVSDPTHPAALGQPLAGQDAVACVAFSPDGNTLASGSGDGTIILWDVSDPTHPAALGQPLAGQDAVACVAFSPDGRTLASGGYGHYNTSGDSTGSIQLWHVGDPARPVALAPIVVADIPFISVSFSADGNTLASGNLSGAVQLWNVADPTRPAALGRHLTQSIEGYTYVAFSPDGHTLATGDGEGTIILWDISNPSHPTALGRPVSVLDVARGMTNAVSALAFSPDARLLVVSSNGGFSNLGIFDSRGSIHLLSLKDPAHPTVLGPYVTAASPGFCSVAFSPDGRILASGSDGGGSGSGLDAGADDVPGSVQLWNATDPTRLLALGRPLT